MGKKTKNKPVYKNLSSSININGQNKSSVSTKKGHSTISYNMDPYEKYSYDYAQQQFAENLSNVNVFSDEVIKNLNNQLKAFQNQGVSTINDVYNPMFRQAQNDIAKRFGNVDNSMFLDKLSDIEDNRSKAVSQLAENVAAKQQELMNQELANRYNYLNFLNGYQNQVQQNMMSMLGLNNSMLNSNANYNNQTANNNNNFFNDALKFAMSASSLIK